MTTEKQGIIIIEPDHLGFLMMLPNGDILWQPTKARAEAAAKKWFKEHLSADIGVGQIEWRLS